MVKKTTKMNQLTRDKRRKNICNQAHLLPCVLMPCHVEAQSDSFSLVNASLHGNQVFVGSQESLNHLSFGNGDAISLFPHSPSQQQGDKEAYFSLNAPDSSPVCVKPPPTHTQHQQQPPEQQQQQQQQQPHQNLHQQQFPGPSTTSSALRLPLLTPVLVQPEAEADLLLPHHNISCKKRGCRERKILQ
jgi:hypothetical protein